MTKTILKPKLLGIITTVFVAGILLGGTNFMTASAAGEIPTWFKGVAGFWSQGLISTEEFLESIQFLITEEIIIVSGFGLLSDVQGEAVDQESLDEIWNAINDLQDQGGDLSGQTLETLTCAVGQIPKYTTTGWACDDDSVSATSLKDLGLRTYRLYNTAFTAGEVTTITQDCLAGDIVVGGGAGAKASDGVDDETVRFSHPEPGYGSRWDPYYETTGWSATVDNTAWAHVWVVCLDLTPIDITVAPSIPNTSLPKIIIPRS